MVEDKDPVEMVRPKIWLMVYSGLRSVFWTDDIDWLILQPPEDPDNVAADEDADEVVSFHLKILPMTFQLHQKHGLRHSDFQRYRNYCSNRLARWFNGWLIRLQSICTLKLFGYPVGFDENEEMNGQIQKFNEELTL